MQKTTVIHKNHTFSEQKLLWHWKKWRESNNTHALNGYAHTLTLSCVLTDDRSCGDGDQTDCSGPLASQSEWPEMGI